MSLCGYARADRRENQQLAYNNDKSGKHRGHLKQSDFSLLFPLRWSAKSSIMTMLLMESSLVRWSNYPVVIIIVQKLYTKITAEIIMCLYMK